MLKEEELFYDLSHTTHIVKECKISNQDKMFYNNFLCVVEKITYDKNILTTNGIADSQKLRIMIQVVLM